ncbi:Uncharacterised protein [Vibrio cholerae]|nr:Uncharacterised protein [Vibrio cholerae]
MTNGSEVETSQPACSISSKNASICLSVIGVCSCSAKKCA